MSEMDNLATFVLATKDELSALQAKVDEDTLRQRLLVDEAKQALNEARLLYGTPAAQIAHILSVLGDTFSSIEINSPDKGVELRPNSDYNYSNQRTVIGERGWVVKVSKGDGPMTVVNNYVQPPHPAVEGDLDE